jgi:hypothetical protein
MKKLLPVLFTRKKPTAPQEKQLYSLWQGLYLCFFSAKFYVDVAQRWRGYGFRYLFVASVLISLPYSVQQMVKMYDYFDNELLLAFSKMPDLTLVKGEVLFDKPMPYVVAGEKNKPPLLVIDTTRSLDHFDEKYRNATLVVTKKAFYIGGKKNAAPFMASQPTLSPLYSNNFPKDATGVLKAKSFEEIVLKVKDKLILMLPFSIALMAFFVEAFILFILSLMTTFVANVLVRYSLSFKQSLRLTYVCGTPQQVIASFMATMNWQRPMVGFLMLGALLFYFCFAVAVNKRAARKMVVA